MSTTFQLFTLLSKSFGWGTLNDQRTSGHYQFCDQPIEKYSHGGSKSSLKLITYTKIYFIEGLRDLNSISPC